MLGFFKRDKNKIAKDGEDHTVDSKELLGEEVESTGREVKTKLHFPPGINVGQEERYYYQFLNNELPLLKENQISLSGIEVEKDEDDSVVVKAFIRNSLPKAIMFNEPVPLLLLGPDEQVLARKTFNLSVFGELPAESSLPWLFTFEKQFVKVEEIPQTDWKLAFELKKEKGPHALDLEESWEKSLADTDKEKLAELVKKMTPPKPGEVNFMGIQARLDKDGSLHTTLLIRNGSDKNVKLEQIPLIIEDASGECVAEGGFILDNFEVKANTSKPWTFIFPQSLLKKEKIDLSKWKAYPPKGA
ncbi:accessory Sec system S-layer assembly protein [Bacillus benzoevorans]|uniref:Accessory Sec system S-layer assembly protein n=1 Tax=Bacillus benzoevorans TaxID=1456 RepID=A0A7X0HSI6_9BACI|nr:accessory Sec system S-layer assembly protein [Bacillus benzoevorans]MBB6446077.1 accessory Sec system S-layer assembly protein [Bacillus benzoevorans]